MCPSPTHRSAFRAERRIYPVARRVATKEVLYQETGQPNRRLELEGELADLEFGLRISFGSRVSGFGFQPGVAR